MSRFLSISVPLQSGQCEQVLLENVNKEVTCKKCLNEATVIAPNGDVMLISQCSQCAFDNKFTNGLGVRIPKQTSLIHFSEDILSYQITYKEWLDAFLNNDFSNLLTSDKKTEEIEERINIILDCVDLEDIPLKTIQIVKHHLELVNDLDKLYISKSKKKARRC